MQAQQLVQALPLRYQEVISLRFGEDKKIREIAEILGKSEGTVKSLLSRAMARLRKEMKNHPMQPFSANGIVHGEGEITT